MENANINLNSAQCIKTMTYWGHDHIANICTGKVQDVAWGQMDYAQAIGGIIAGIALIGVIIALACGFAGMAYSTWKEGL